MLYQFLVDHRAKILGMTRDKAEDASEDKPTTVESERGLPQFYDHLVGELKREDEGKPSIPEKSAGPDTTAKHGKEMKRLGYTVSQVVQGYGGLCQAITELAAAEKSSISPEEFKTLNLLLDGAIAEAVTEFGKRAGSVDCAKKMGFLAHELRNALTASIVAHSMIKKGVVGHGGSTNAILERNLDRMKEILDRSFSEIRMENGKDVEKCPVLLIDVAEEVEATAGEEAQSKGLNLRVSVGSGLKVVGDHHLLVSALSNLVQNAIKYSKKGGTIWVRGRETEKNEVLEVEDQCGGLPKGKVEELFQPYVQKNEDRSGLGLGLTISRRAVALNGGTLTVRDLPGKGCVFTITLPKPKGPSSSEAAAAVPKPVPAKR
jgi:signal transduction histidine kinase